MKTTRGWPHNPTRARISRTLFAGACVWSLVIGARCEEAASVETQERHFVFAKAPEMNMARVIRGEPTGIKAAFRFDQNTAKPNNQKGILELKIDRQQFEFPTEQILNQSVALPGTPWMLNRVKFLPDFRLENKEAVSASDQPNNPALVFEVSGHAAASGKLAAEKCDHAEGACDHTQQKACCPPTGTQSPAAHTDGAHLNGDVPSSAGGTASSALGPENRTMLGVRSDTTSKVNRDLVWVLEWLGSLVLGTSLFMVFQYRRSVRRSPSGSLRDPSASFPSEPRGREPELSPPPMLQPGSGRVGTS